MFSSRFQKFIPLILPMISKSRHSLDNCWIPFDRLAAAGHKVEDKQRSSSEDLDLALQSLDFDVQFTTSAYASLLRQCGISRSLKHGKRVHAHLIETGRDRGTYIGNFLIEMYGKCRSVQEALPVFENIHQKNVFSWTIMIAAYAQNGHYKEALELFRLMDLNPTSVTFTSVLGVCSNLKAQGLAEGRKIHSRIVACGLETDNAVANTLVNMYGKCGSLQDAKAVFEGIQKKDVVSCNAMIDAYVHCGHATSGIELYRKMKDEPIGVHPNEITFISVLGACSSLGILTEGIAIHADIIASGLQKDVALGTTLVSMYGKCGSLTEARNVFDCMPQRGVVTWNAMVAAYTQRGHSKEATGLFRRMDLDGVKPNEATFVSLLSACCNTGDPAEASQLEARIVACKYDGDALAGALVNFYGKMGNLDDARRFFEMHHRDVASWNCMIAGYAQNGHGEEALGLYKRMQTQGTVRPNGITFINVLSACSIPEDVKMIHAGIAESGSELSEKVLNTLISTYSKCGGLEDAKSVFEKMQHRTVVSWNAMIAAYAQHGHAQEALDVYKRMCAEDDVKPDEYTFVNIAGACSDLGALEEAKFIHEQVTASMLGSDAIVGTALVNMYAKCGSLDDAKFAFDRLDAKNVVSWSAMIAAYAQAGLGKDALELFRQMDLEGVKPNAVTFVSVIEAYTIMADLVQSTAIHVRVLASGFDKDNVVRTALINMHGRSGNLIDARSTFEDMSSSDSLAWTAMITAYAQHGIVHEALDLLQEMQLNGVEPDVVTLLSILSACSHAGLLKEGWHYFASLSMEYELRLRADHYSCLIDLLGRAGWADEAEHLIMNMPFEPDVVAWTSLLGACSVHGDVERGERAASKLLELNSDAAPYVLMANMYQKLE